MKERVLKNLKKLADADLNQTQKNYIEEAIDYVELSEEPTKELVDADWLRKRILDDIYNRKCDGMVFTKVSRYLFEYEENHATEKNI